MQTRRLVLVGIIATLSVLVSTAGAHAVDRPCKTDIDKLCKDVRGRPNLQECLKKHVSELSAGCKEKMDAGQGVFAAAPGRGAFLKACEADQKKFCAGEAVGKGRIRRCLRNHVSELSPACKAHFPAGRRGGGFVVPCREDLKKHCEGVKPGAGKVLECLRGHEAELSNDCREALSPGKKAKR